MWQYIAYLMIAIGALVLVGWGIYTLFSSDEIHVLFKVAAGVIGLGALILVGVAVGDRITKTRNEDFRGIEN
jgi:hypothetical protein